MLAAAELALTMVSLATVPRWERSALVDLYSATGGEHWRNSSAWLSGDPCADRWFGIFCNTDDSHVTAVFPNPRMRSTL